MIDTCIYELETKWKKVSSTTEDHDVMDANSIRRYLRGTFSDRPEQEHLIVLHLDTNMKVKGREMVSLGTMISAAASPTQVFRSALHIGSFAIVLVHNHPGGDLTPSDADKEATKNLIACGKILGIPVVEHYICDSDLELVPIKLTNKFPALWAMKPSFVDDPKYVDADGMLDVDIDEEGNYKS